VPYDPDTLDRRDARQIEQLLPVAEWLSANYFRSSCEGEEHVPDTPALFVSNHNGGMVGPELVCTLAALWRIRSPASPLYALAHDFAMAQLTPLGRLLQLAGAVRATRSNAERVLARGGQLLVYPGGDIDAYRHFKRRNQVVILPRTGFVRIAQKLRAPIVPIVAAGAHRSAVILAEGKRVARALQMRRWARLERFPIALALPWGLALGPWLPYLPLPFRVRLRILPPMHIAQDDLPVEGARRVQTAMQRALDEMSVD
jgi:1-acyl-sn-glycerol-3-phosphate acyltransferase